MFSHEVISFPACIYWFRVNNESTRAICEICSKVTNKDTRTTSLVPLLLTWNRFHSPVILLWRIIIYSYFERVSHKFLTIVDLLQLTSAKLYQNDDFWWFMIFFFFLNSFLRAVLSTYLFRHVSLIIKTIFKLHNKNERMQTLETQMNQIYTWWCSDVFNPFVSNAPILYSLKTSENRKVFWYIQGVEEGCIGNKWINVNFQEMSTMG